MCNHPVKENALNNLLPNNLLLSVNYQFLFKMFFSCLENNMINSYSLSKVIKIHSLLYYLRKILSFVQIKEKNNI